MPAPVLSAQQIAQVTADQTAQQGTAAAMAAGAIVVTAKAAAYGVTDSAFKLFFDYYNDSIIGKYDAERKALNGQFIASPITEADVLGPAILDTAVRTTPAAPATDIVRVAQFDGGPLITTTTNESQHISDQAVVESVLTSGDGTAHFDPTTAVTNTALTSASTTLEISDTTNPLTIVVNDIITIIGSGFAAVVKITTSPGIPSGPPYDAVYGISFIAPPLGTIALGAPLYAFTGFTNSERTSKTATIPTYQPLMNALVASLQSLINNRKSRLSEELTALAANQDPDGVANIATATTNANSSNSFLTSYLVSTDISNTGLSSLSSDRSTRSGQITTRLGQIVAAYTGQTKNYFNQRYNMANNRANTVSGSLRLQKVTLASISQINSYATIATTAAAALGSIL